jgi:hypothetical protein
VRRACTLFSVARSALEYQSRIFNPKMLPWMHALADEILKYRRAVRLLAQAIGWAGAGAPFAIIPPGPYWRPSAAGNFQRFFRFAGDRFFRHHRSRAAFSFSQRVRSRFTPVLS